MKKYRYFLYLTAVIGFACLLSSSWLKWGNLVIDNLRDPWVAYKIIEGKALYRDIFYMFGFLPVYFISFLYKIFGVHLNCVIGAGIAVTAVSAFFIYRIGRVFLGRGLSTLLVLNFLFVFAFGCYCYTGIFNFILPYTVASTFFIMFVLAGIFFFIKFLRTESLPYFLCWAVSLCLAFACRVHMSLIAWLAFAFTGAVCGLKRKKAILIIGVFLPPVFGALFFWFFLSANDAFSEFMKMVIGAVNFKGRAGREFFISGLAAMPGSLITLLKSFLFQLSAALFFYYAAAFAQSAHFFKKSEAPRPHRRGFCLFGIPLKPWNGIPPEKPFIRALTGVAFRRRGKKAECVFLYAIAGVLSAVTGLLFIRFINYSNQYRPVPLLLLIVFFVSLARVISQEKDGFGKSASILALSAVSIVLLPRILLKASPNHYGFYLLAPGLICYYVFFAELCPYFFEKTGVPAGPVKKYYVFSLLVFFSVLALPFAKANRLAYKNKNFCVKTGRGTICSFNDSQTRVFWDTVAYAKEFIPPGATVAVFPEGVGINFFSRRENPSKYYHFLPPQTAATGEENILKEFKRNKIDYIVLLSRFTPEYGLPRFGVDYCQVLASWLIKKYRLEKTIGRYPFDSGSFGAAVFKRK